MAEVWDRCARESGQAWEAFQLYRDLGDDRSVLKVAEGLSKSLAICKRWSARWNWVARVRAWDTMLYNEVRRAFVKERRAMAERHARLGMAMQRPAVERLKVVQPADISPSDVPRWIKEGVMLERLARGASTENRVLTLEEAEVMADGLADLILGLMHFVPKESRDEFREQLDCGIARIFATTSPE